MVCVTSDDLKKTLKDGLAAEKHSSFGSHSPFTSFLLLLLAGFISELFEKKNQPFESLDNVCLDAIKMNSVFFFQI